MRYLACTLPVVFALSAPITVVADPPEVTAKGWAILNGNTGELLWGHEAEQPRKAASTTKIMCAYVVLQLAADDPKVLEEWVGISELADNTSGSTADVNAGESVRVSDLLYGLLLPSGNDAGNALAEHFNARCDPPSAELVQRAGLDADHLATRANFVAQMNRTAQDLGLESTTYRNPFGDGGDEQSRTTCPKELGTLAWHALQLGRFRQIVSTKSYECQVRTADGGERTATWTNTNRLLGKNGYDGVKTGTTNSAGCCLVSSSRRGDRHLIAVVLGSNQDDDRYTDTEALIEWAWGEVGKQE